MVGILDERTVAAASPYSHQVRGRHPISTLHPKAVCDHHSSTVACRGRSIGIEEVFLTRDRMDLARERACFAITSDTERRTRVFRKFLTTYRGFNGGGPGVGDQPSVYGAWQCEFQSSAVNRSLQQCILLVIPWHIFVPLSLVVGRARSHRRCRALAAQGKSNNVGRTRYSPIFVPRTQNVAPIVITRRRGAIQQCQATTIDPDLVCSYNPRGRIPKAFRCSMTIAASQGLQLPQQ